MSLHKNNKSCIEKYDPNQPVCDNQNDFNIAVQKAVQYDKQQMMKKDKPYAYVYFALLCIFIFWAIMIAMKKSSSDRIVQLVFAIVFSPFYVVSHYLSLMNPSSGYAGSAQMGMCGCSKEF